jgi:starch phosphorylase
VTVTAWKYDVASADDFTVPVYFLDSDLPENSPEHRQLTGQLYGGDNRYRLSQEALLGIGGIRMLRALGHDAIERFHMNEGHASLLTVELLREQREQHGRSEFTEEDINTVRSYCVFTTHTPVVAGHDSFDLQLVERVLGHRNECGITDAICHAGQLNMTYLALALSHYVNGVAKKHSEISQQMFAQYEVDAITNGVHAATWVSRPLAELFDRYIRGWRQDNFSLRYALGIPDNDLWQAHQEAKRTLIEVVNRQSNAGFDADILTLGFGRRATSYKRAALIFEELERVRRISTDIGSLQIVFAGKAHPNDGPGKAVIQKVVHSAKQLGTDLAVVYLPNYEQHLAALMTAGVDVWLNTPEPPMEASGTSGMKAALNGVPSLSVLDGWWIEGCLEGVTGWAIGQRDRQVYGANAESLCQKLEEAVVPMFYENRVQFIDVMRHAIALNGSFFNTQRMLYEYMVRAYLIGPSSAT